MTPFHIFMQQLNFCNHGQLLQTYQRCKLKGMHVLIQFLKIFIYMLLLTQLQGDRYIRGRYLETSWTIMEGVDHMNIVLIESYSWQLAKVSIYNLGEIQCICLNSLLSLLSVPYSVITMTFISRHHDDGGEQKPVLSFHVSIEITSYVLECLLMQDKIFFN